MAEIVERRRHHCLTDEQMELLIATVTTEVSKRVQISLKDMMYRELGKSIAEQAPSVLGSIIEKGLWFLGIVGTAIFVYLNAHGFIDNGLPK